MHDITEAQIKQIQNILSLQPSETNVKLMEHILKKLTNDKFKSDSCSRIYNYLVCIAIGIMLILVGLIVVFMIEPALLGAEHNRDFKTIVQIITSNCTCALSS
jgi:hypothetical protein